MLFRSSQENTTNILGLSQDLIQKGAFINTINGVNRDRIAFCKDHDLRDVIGVIVDLKEDERGLWFRAKVSKTRDGKDIEVLIEDGALKEFSIGFITKGYEWNEDDGVRTLTEVELWEISLVTRAANEQARLVTTEVKSEADTKGLSDDELIERKNKALRELRLLQNEIDLFFISCSISYRCIISLIVSLSYTTLVSTTSINL